MIKKKNAAPKRRKKIRSTDTANFERRLKQSAKIKRLSLCLYVAGITPRSSRAVANIRALCEELLPGKYDLKVVDIYQRPHETINAQIIAAPTLIKRLPLPLKRLIGDLSNRDKVIIGLNLSELTKKPA